MNGKIQKIWLLAVFLLCGSADNRALGESRQLSPCPTARTVSQLLLRQPPERVLLVPLLSEKRGAQQDRWAERPASSVAAFYRRRFRALVTVMRDIWGWQDFYEQAKQMQQLAMPFDRVIFIGHGGFDGPVLDDHVYRQDLLTDGNKTELLQLSEAQPGLKNVISIRYDSNQNRQFADYIATHARELAGLRQSEIRFLLNGLEEQWQPMDSACFDRYCSADKLATTDKSLANTRITLCRRICRKPLFALKATVELSSERFFHFIKALQSLTTENGLIFFGSCNPGSAAPKQLPAWAESDLLINSNVAGGPYRSYVHLVSAASDRIAAGPIGNSSGDDIVNRIKLFEEGRRQNYLCIVTPAAARE